MSLEKKLFNKKLNLAETKENDRKKQVFEKENQLFEEIKDLHLEKTQWEEKLSLLEESYEKAGKSLIELKKVRQEIDDIYNNPKFAEVIGDKDKHQFIEENQEEEEIQDYREKENLVRSLVQKIEELKNFFKEKMPDLEFKAGEKSANSPRETAKDRLKEKIVEMDEKEKNLSEQTALGQAEIINERKREIISDHDQTREGARTEIYPKDLKYAEQWGEDFVKQTIVDFNQQKIRENIAKLKEKTGLDKKEEFIDFKEKYQKEKNIISQSFDDLTEKIHQLSGTLQEKLEADEKLNQEYKAYYRGMNKGNLATTAINEKLATSHIDTIGKDNPAALSEQLEKQYINENWEKIFGGEKNTAQLGSIKNPDYIQEKIGVYNKALAVLEDSINNNPEELVKSEKTDEVREIVHDKEGKILAEENFYVDKKIVEYFEKGGDINKLETETKEELKEIEERKKEKYENAKKEIEYKWLDEKVQKKKFEIQEIIQYKELVKKLKETVLVINWQENDSENENLQKEAEEAIQKGGTHPASIPTHLPTSIETNEKKLKDWEKGKADAFKEVERLKTKKEENEGKKRIFNKNKLNSELNEIEKQLESQQNYLDKTDSIIIKLEAQNRKRQEAFSLLKENLELVIKKNKNLNINMPSGYFKDKEYLEKINDILKKVFDHSLNVNKEDEEKLRAYNALKEQADKAYEEWGGKPTW